MTDAKKWLLKDIETFWKSSGACCGGVLDVCTSHGRLSVLRVSHYHVPRPVPVRKQSAAIISSKCHVDVVLVLDEVEEEEGEQQIYPQECRLKI